MFMKLKNLSMKICIPLISILAAFIVGGILIVAIGGNPIEAFAYLFKGAAGNPVNIGRTLVKATPLIFTGLAATFAYKCGVFNLGAEGQFVIGAIASLWFSTSIKGISGVPLIILSLIMGIIVGGIYGAIPGILKITRGLNEMIVSIMLNYVAILFMGYLYSGPLREGSVPQTEAISDKLKLGLLSGTHIHIGFIIAIIFAATVYYFLFYTSKGFKLRAVGMNDTASMYNGFSVKKYIIVAFIVSGALAGIGGSIELHSVQYRLMSGFGTGYGFDGVAIALIGQLNPIGTVLVACLFAALRTGANTMQVGTGMPTSVIDIIQALVIVFAVAGTAFINLPSIKQYFINMSLKKKLKEVSE